MKNLSIIIPSFNSEQHIKNCLNSIFNQNLQIEDFEVIFIDDGSTDNTQKIIQSFQNDFSNIIYIFQKNSGVSAARNAGIKNACGKYLLFIDADDFYSPNSIQKILSQALKTNVDALGFSHNRIVLEKTKKVSRGTNTKNPITGIEWAKRYIGETYYSVLFIYKREFLKKNNLQFNKNVTVWEDFLFISKFLCLANFVSYIDMPTYNYVYYLNSLSNTKFFKNLTSRFVIIASLLKFKLFGGLTTIQKKFITNRIYIVFLLLVDSITRYHLTNIFTAAKRKVLVDLKKIS